MTVTLPSKRKAIIKKGLATYTITSNINPRTYSLDMTEYFVVISEQAVTEQFSVFKTAGKWYTPMFPLSGNGNPSSIIEVKKYIDDNNL